MGFAVIVPCDHFFGLKASVRFALDAVLDLHSSGRPPHPNHHGSWISILRRRMDESPERTPIKHTLARDMLSLRLLCSVANALRFTHRRLLTTLSPLFGLGRRNTHNE